MVRPPILATLLVAVLAIAGCHDFPFAVGDLPVCDTLDTDPVCKDLYGSSVADTAGILSTSSTSSTDMGAVGTTGGGDGESGDVSSGGAGESSGADDLDRVIALRARLTAWPSPVLLVGPVNLTLKVEGPAVSVDLYDGETLLLKDGAPIGELYNFDVTSQDQPGDGLHAFRAVVRASDGRTALARADLEIDVPASGTQDWEHVVGKQVSAYSSVAMLGHDTAVAGYEISGDKTQLAVARLDRATGQPISGPLLLESIVWSGEAHGPAIATAADGAVYVAATRRVGDSTTRVVYKLRMDGPMPTLVWAQPAIGSLDEDANAIAVVGDTLVVAGSVRTAVNPNTYDLRVWWLSPETGILLHASPYVPPPGEDDENILNERAYGVAIVGDEVVVVGTREVWPEDLIFKRTRSVVLRYALDGAFLGEWTSPGDVVQEDAALAVTPTKGGGFALTGWARTEGKRSVLTRRFAPGGAHLWARPEFTGAHEAVGHALAEDLEGKLIVAAGRERPGTNLDAWVFAVLGQNGPPTWELLRNGASDGPDEAVGVVLDELGYIHAVGSELTNLEIHAFALRLFP